MKLDEILLNIRIRVFDKLIMCNLMLLLAWLIAPLTSTLVLIVPSHGANLYLPQYTWMKLNLLNVFSIVLVYFNFLEARKAIDKINSVVVYCSEFWVNSCNLQ